MEHQEKLISLFQTVGFYGSQQLGLPLRGHTDSGQMELKMNDRNFSVLSMVHSIFKDNKMKESEDDNMTPVYVSKPKKTKWNRPNWNFGLNFFGFLVRIIEPL